jgi:hypothetical protein
MMVNAPGHTLAASPFLPDAAAPQRAGLVEWSLRKIQGLVCGLHGHDSVLQYERTRIFLRCASCGHETPGWEVPRRPLAFERRAERPVRADLEIVRRIA